MRWGQQKEDDLWDWVTNILQKIKNGSDWKYIGLDRNFLSEQQLWSYVIRSTWHLLVLLHFLKRIKIVCQSKINDFNIFYSLSLSYKRSCALEYFFLFPFLETDNYILWFEIPMHNVQRMKVVDSFDDMSNNKSTFKFVQIVPVLHISE